MIASLLLALAVQVPNDPRFISQYALHQIHVPGAWAITTGSTATRIVILDDSGIAPHFDLPVWGGPAYDGCHVHATIMAGIMGALTNNGLGISGIMWDVGLIPIISIGQADVLAADLEAVRTTTTAKIILVEFPVTLDFGRPPLRSVVQAINSEGRGLVIPVGNDWTGGKNVGQHHRPGMLVVGGINLSAPYGDGARWPFSNFGGIVDVWAPVHWTSVMPPDVIESGDGTSDSAAALAAIMGLMSTANPDLTFAQLADLVVGTASASPAGPLVDAQAAVEAAAP